MAKHSKIAGEAADDTMPRLAQVAKSGDRLEYLSTDGAVARTAHEWERLHHAVINAVSDVVLITDDAGRFVYVSPNAHYIFGCPVTDNLEHGHVSSFLPDDLFDPDVLAERCEIKNIECVIRDAVGRARNLLVSVYQVDNLRGGTILYACRDVTERKKMELDHELLSLDLERRVEARTRQLRESRDRYRRFVESLRDEYFFFATDPDGVVTYVSPSVHAITGYSPDEAVGRNWRDFFDPDSPIRAQLEKVERMQPPGLPAPTHRVPIEHASGASHWLEVRGAPVYDADGRVIAIEGIAKDVTEREQAEETLRLAREGLERRVMERTAELTDMNERLRESEQRYRMVVEDHPEFIVRWRDEGIRTFVNEAYCRYRGLPREELLGHSFLSLISEEDRQTLRAQLAQLSVENPVFVDERYLVLPDGRTVWQRWVHRALFNEEGKLAEFQAVGSDITERHKAEEHTREQSMARLQLAGLTARERDVMHLVVAGDANKVIARKLNLSVKTIEKHRSSLMKKLHVRSVPELVRLAMLAEGNGA